MSESVIGSILDVDGNSAECALDLETLIRLRDEGANELTSSTSVGCYVKIDVGDRWLLATVNKVRLDRSDERRFEATIDFLGEGRRMQNGSLLDFNRGVTIYPLPGDKIWLAQRDDLVRVFSPESSPHVEIGTVYPTSDIRASLLYDKLLGRHFAVLGSTGAGKSTFVSLLLHRVMERAPESHIVVLDPHGEYSKAFASSGQVYNVSNLQIPYWMMNLEEHCEAFIPEGEESRDIDVNVLAKCLFAARTKNDDFVNIGMITADSPIPYNEGDLIDSLDEEMGRLEKQAEAQTYMRLKSNIEQMFSDNRYRFIFDDSCRLASMNNFLSDLLRIPGQGRPISIIDLSEAPSQIVKVVVSLLSRIILDYAIWSPKHSRVPILLVCEEAQRYLPAIHTERAMSAERQLERISREGRKYGVSLGLITQRPTELSETALSQCGTIISLRLTNINDQKRIRAALPDASGSLVDLIPALQNRECIICGEAARLPVRVRIDEAKDEIRPASEDPEFSELWKVAAQNEQVIDDTVRRWRGG